MTFLQLIFIALCHIPDAIHCHKALFVLTKEYPCNVECQTREFSKKAQLLCALDIVTIQQINPHPSRLETDNLPSTMDLSGLVTLKNIYVNNW